VGLSRSSHWQLAEAVTRGVVGVSAPITLVEFPFSLVDAACASTVAELASRGVGVLAASALAGGALTGKYRHTTPADSRAASPHLRHMVEPYLSGFANSVIEATHRAASGLDRRTGDVALAWVRDYPGISSALIGPRTTRQLDTLLEYTEPLPAPIREVLSEVAQ
jgi:aryl-alcohol dehydrogenase-like predicted oxidoreductase